MFDTKRNRDVDVESVNASSPSTSRPSWVRRELKIVGRIVPPIVAQYGSQQLVMATQLIYCGNVSRRALTTMTVASTLWNMVWMPITGAGTAMDALGSQAHGMQDARAVKSWAMLTTFSLLAWCVPATAFLAGSESVSKTFFHAKSEDAVEIRDCALIMALGMWPLAVTLGLQKYASVQNKVWAVGATSILTLFANVAFHEAFVRSAGGGVIGSSWAMVCSRCVNLVSILIWIGVDEKWWRGGALEEHRAAFAAVTKKMTKRVAQLSSSGVLMVFGEAFAFELTVVLASRLGEVSLGAHMVMLNIATFTFMCGPMAFGTSASIRVGNLLGAGDPWLAKRSAWLVIAMSMTFMLCCAVTIITAAKEIAKLYTGGDADITRELMLIAPFGAMFQICDGLLGACNGVLRACGKLALIAKSNLVSLWTFGVLSAFLFTYVGDAGVRGLWWGLAIGVISAGSFLAILVVRLDWTLESEKAKTAATNVVRDDPDDSVAPDHADSVAELT